MRTVTSAPYDCLSPEPPRAPRAPRRRAAALAQVALVVAAFGGAVGTTLKAAHAETADPAKAEELIREANDQRRHGHDERAVPLLRKAYEIAHSARTAGQLGLAEMALGYWVSAETHLNEAVAENRNPWVTKNRAALDSALRETQTHLGNLRIEGKPDGAEISVNGSVVGTLPLGSPVRVGEGRVTVEARAPGRKSMSTAVTVAAHGDERVQIALEAEESPPPAQPTARVVPTSSTSSVTTADTSVSAGQPARTERSARETGKAPAADAELPTWRRVLPWALLGGAAIAGGIGVWQQLSSQSAQSGFDGIAACGAGLPMRGSDARCQGLYDDFQSRKTHAFIGYGVAGVLGAGAVTLFIVNAASTPAPSTASAHGQAALALTGDSAFLSYAGRF